MYDPDVIACLVKLLSRLLKDNVQENHPDVYIASAVRNPQTYDCFKKELGRFHFNILFHYTIDLKHIHYCWFFIVNETFLLFTERAGLRHVIMKDSVTQVFPYNRASTIEMTKIYVWQKQSLCSKVFIYKLFTSVLFILIFKSFPMALLECWLSHCGDR